MTTTNSNKVGRPKGSKAKTPDDIIPYATIEDIPLHVFTNRMCTQTDSPDLKDYLLYMLEHCPDDLAYIYDYTQQWCDIEGATYKMTFKQWKTKLQKDING